MQEDERHPRSDAIFHGDCLELLRQIKAASVDLVVSSPPYNLGKEYESKRALERYLKDQTVVLEQCARVLKPTGSIFWQVGAYADEGLLIPLDVRFFPILESLGMIPRNRIVWVRQHGVHASKKFSCRHETILWFTKSGTWKFNLDAIRVPQKYQNKKRHAGPNRGELSCNPLGKNPGDVWVFQNVKHNHEEQTIHPCQFPEDLITRIVLATTNEGDTVLDPYMGADTVAVVARDFNRHYMGAETDDRYFDVSQRRLNCRPNEERSFPNLKTLRAHVQQTGEPIGSYRFDVQAGKFATESDKSRIYPEHYHLESLEQRLSYEEDAATARARRQPEPKNPHPQHLPKPRKAETPSLFGNP